MKTKIIILAIVLCCIPIVYGITTGDSVMDISISYDGGTTYSDPISKTWTCNPFDQSKTYGGSSEMWGESNWTEDELNNTNLRVRFNLTNQAGVNTRMTVDHVQVKIYYTLPIPQLNYTAPTPSNNSNIGSTLTVNVICSS